MSITVRFVCGHAATVGLSQVVDPVCPSCGETRVARTSAPPPRFRGMCSGPYAETAAVDPAVVNLAPKGALTLKQQE